MPADHSLGFPAQRRLSLAAQRATQRLLAAGFALFLLLPGPAGAFEDTPAWFSDTPPSREWAKRTRYAHGGPVERGRGGLYVKRLWYREGDALGTADYPRALRSLSYDLLVVGPDGQPLMPSVFQATEGNGIIFSMPQEGFHNAYLVMREVRQGQLFAAVLKAEVLKHNCGEGHDPRITASKMPPRSAPQVPFEIVRERVPKEDFHTHLHSGDAVAFRVLHEGKPAAGAMVRMTTEAGWSRTVTTDQEGRAVFRLIRDYYPEWSLFNKRNSQPFLVTAQYEVARSGRYEGADYRLVRYSGSLPGTYYPPPRDYQSYLYGLLVMIVALVLTAGAVYLYRLRITKPSRERFDEAN